MSTPVIAPGLGSRGKDDIEATFAKIIESEALRAAPVSRTLLLYLWEHKGERLSEYAIAVDGLGRSSGFDPKTDATVRVQIARLRNKLKEFYDADGHEVALRLHIPLGTHELKWTYAKPDPTWIAAPRQFVTRYPLAVAGVAVAAVVLAITLGALLRVSTQKGKTARQIASAGIWAPMLNNGKPTVAVLTNSNGFQWTQSGITILAPSVPAFDEWNKSPALSALGEKWGPPALSQVYAVARHAVAGFKVLDFLSEHGGSVQAIESADLPSEGWARQNTILAGSPNSGLHIRSLMEKTDFSLARGASPSLVHNKSPKPGEPVDFREIELSRERRICPGIIVWLPPRPEGTQVVLLVGRWTTALATMLTSTDGLHAIEQELKKIGSPTGWEMVVQAEVQADTTVLRTWPVAVHAVPASYWK